MDGSVLLQLHRSSILRLHPDRPLVARPKFHWKLSDQQNWGEIFSHLCAVYWRPPKSERGCHSQEVATQGSRVTWEYTDFA